MLQDIKSKWDKFSFKSTFGKQIIALPGRCQYLNAMYLLTKSRSWRTDRA